jgi:hypothetical protein
MRFGVSPETCELSNAAKRNRLRVVITQSHDPDQLETCARSFLLVHVVFQVAKSGPEPVPFLLVGSKQTGCGPSILNVWSFLNDDSFNIQIYHIFKD